MRILLRSITALFLLAMPGFAAAQSAVSEQCVMRSLQLTCAVVNAAANDALASIRSSERQGRVVDTARQVLAEGDRVCMLMFLVHDQAAARFSVDDHFCYTQEGAYDLRREGISQGQINTLVRYLDSLRNHPDSWRQFEANVLGDQARFATLQRLIRADYKTDLIRLLFLRRDTVFINQYHPDGMISN